MAPRYSTVLYAMDMFEWGRKATKMKENESRDGSDVSLPEARHGVTLSADEQSHILTATTLNDVTFSDGGDTRRAAVDWL